MSMWGTKCVANLVVDHQLLLEGFVCVDDVGWHPCSAGKLTDQGSDDLVEAFVHINAGSSDMSPGELLDFEVKLCVVPSLLSTSTWDPSIHGRILPCFDPWCEVLDPDRGPNSVQDWCDLENSVCHGVSKVFRILAQKNSSCFCKRAGPLVGGFDEVEPEGKPLEGCVRCPV